MILVDSNVLLDLVTADPVWAEWSARELRAAAATDELAVNEIVFAELSVRYTAIHQVEDLLRRTPAILVRMPRAALFLAGKVFQRYRAAGGIRAGSILAESAEGIPAGLDL